MGTAAIYQELVEDGPAKLSDLIQALRSFLGTNDMMAYLTMMAVRLVEMRRVLRNTGSIYLHCDPTASHYLKLGMDSVFGVKNFRNEIIWRRTATHGKAKRYGPIHDVILFYTKSDEYFWSYPTRPYMRGHVEGYFVKDEKGWRTNYYGNVLTGSGTRTGESDKPWRGFDPTAKGRHWAIPRAVVELIEEDLSALTQHEKLDRLYELGYIRIVEGQAWPIYEHYLSPSDGMAIGDIWAYEPYTEGSVFGTDDGIDKDVRWLSPQDQERLGYPTQKPEGIIERITRASCPQGGLVLDPFCGCGTTIAVAEHLHRRWIGIDITFLAIDLMERRLKDSFGKQLAPYSVFGKPTDLPGARALSEADKHQFEFWARSLVHAKPAQGEKKGADRGIDGVINFFDDESGKAKKIVVQVKSGHVSVHQVRDLCHVVGREKAVMGVFVTLEAPTLPMKKEAAGFGFYTPEHYPDRNYPRMQLLTIEELLADAEVKYPKTLAPQATFKKAAAKKKAPRSSDRGHPEAMFEDGLLANEDE